MLVPNTIRYGKFKGYCDQRYLKCQIPLCKGCRYCCHLPYVKSVLRESIKINKSVRNTTTFEQRCSWNKELDSLIFDITNVNRKINQNQDDVVTERIEIEGNTIISSSGDDGGDTSLHSCDQPDAEVEDKVKLARSKAVSSFSSFFNLRRVTLSSLKVK